MNYVGAKAPQLFSNRKAERQQEPGEAEGHRRGAESTLMKAPSIRYDLQRLR
jgi:hypothetical protein